MKYPPASRAEQRELRRKAEFLSRVVTPDDDAFRICPIPGCGRPPQARAGRGVSLLHCRYHIQRRNRHGSLWKGTYSAADLKPYRQAAETYIKANRTEFWISHALIALERLMDGAGPVERVPDLRTATPRQKARGAFARMRAKGVSPLRLLRDHLAISAAIKEDPIGPGGEPDEYRLTQIGKAALRKASGYHAIYGPKSRYDVYPRSAGRMLRIIGKMLDRACEHVVHYHLDRIQKLTSLQVRNSKYGTP